MMTDPIADMLTRIRNAQKVGHASVEVPFSRLKMKLAEILIANGFLDSVEKGDTNPVMLVLGLKYYGKDPAIKQITRESTPGHRMYRNAEELPRVLNDYGIAIISTSKGLVTNKEARKIGIGGEVICSVY